jgi:hypothetical protein
MALQYCANRRTIPKRRVHSAGRTVADWVAHAKASSVVM